VPEPVTNETLAERIESVIASVNRVARAVEIQNGRVSRIELDRAEEKGSREAVAQAAAATAAALERATNLRDKSRTWKATVVVSAAAALGCVVTVGTLAAHALIYHAI
jgi:dihydroorotase-like cyclic amidohydrolase